MGLSQRQLAEVVQTRQATISLIERRKSSTTGQTARRRAK